MHAIEFIACTHLIILTNNPNNAIKRMAFRLHFCHFASLHFISIVRLKNHRLSRRSESIRGFVVKRKLQKLFLCAVFLPIATIAAESAKSQSDWVYGETVDQMSGKVGKSVSSISKNFVEGWLKKYPIVFVYRCNGSIDLFASGMGFEIDDSECDENSCTSLQYTRVKFDNGAPVDMSFEVGEKNNEFMTLEEFQSYPKRNNFEFLINGMKKSNNLYIEVELFNTKGSQQIVEFPLAGFSNAAKNCK